MDRVTSRASVRDFSKEKTDLETDGDVTRQLARGRDYGPRKTLCKELFGMDGAF